MILQTLNAYNILIPSQLCLQRLAAIIFKLKDQVCHEKQRMIPNRRTHHIILKQNCHEKYEPTTPGHFLRVDLFQ